MSAIESDIASLSASVRERWDDGAVVDLVLSASAPVGDWQVELDAGGRIVNIWNAKIVSQNGTRYVLEAEDYNEMIGAGTSIAFGFQIEGTGEVALSAVDVVLSADLAAETAINPRPAAPVEAVAPAFPRNPAEAYAPLPRPTVDPLGDGAPRYRANDVQLKELPSQLDSGEPQISVLPTSVTEPAGTGLGLPRSTFAPGPLSTSGANIIDSEGAPVKLHGLNWFGLETDIFVPHGLWARNWREIMDEVKSLGFNTLRMPFSGELVASGGGNASGIDHGLNPDLVGLNGLEVLDKIVDYADTIGLKIVLDYHRGPPGGGPNENGLWFGNGRTEADVIAEWQMMAERYRDKPAVIGADLINEPFQATWGDGSATDWAAAAERIGGAIQAIAPNWLIIVEGISVHDGDPYWWGGNLQGVRERPVELPIPGKLVYSPHDYPASVHPQEWFFDGTDLVDKFRENWGYIAEEGIAPILVGEWGSRLDTAQDWRWADELTRYLRDTDVSWLWWSLNPNSGDTGGLYDDDWTRVRPEVLDLLEPFTETTRPEIALTNLDAIANDALFEIVLSEPAPDAINLKYATVDGTARAGRDYKATAGTVTIAEGEQAATVAVPVLPDSMMEGDEFFYLVLGAGGATRGSGTAVIEAGGDPADPNARRPVQQPFVDVAGTVVVEGAGAALFRVILSEPAAEMVTLEYATSAETATGADFEETRGTLTLPPGSRGATLEVAVGDDDLPEDAERFTLEVTSAQGAQIRSGRATAIIPAERAAVAQVAVAPSATAETQATIDLILENDWGNGALFNVVIKNVSDTPISRWELSLDVPFDLSELWSAVLVDDTADRVTVQNAEWNGEIAPGAQIDFGFIADMGDIALGALLNGADIELAVQ